MGNFQKNEDLISRSIQFKDEVDILHCKIEDLEAENINQEHDCLQYFTENPETPLLNEIV